MATINGGGGNDTLNGTSGDDVIGGAAGADTISGGAGNDSLYSGDISPPFDQFTGDSSTPPLLDTGTEVDRLNGGTGNDLLFGGFGDDIDGGDGGDELFISFQGASSGISFDITLASQVIGGGTITGIESAAWVQGSNFDDNIVLGTSFYSPYADEGIAQGMGGNDRIVAGYNTAVLDGGEGNDVLDGRNSLYLREVDGGAGSDTLYGSRSSLGEINGGDGNDRIYIYGSGDGHGGAGDDILGIQRASSLGGFLAGDGGNDRLTGDDSGNILEGDDGLDRLQGSAGNDRIDGGADSDTLSGDAGNDTLTGGGGSDTFLFGQNDGQDVITDFAAGEILRVDGYQHAQSITQVGDDVVVAFSAADRITFQNTDVATVTAGLVFGITGNDTLTGTPEDDYLRGFGGNDTISGGAGNDWLSGDSGADTITGGDGVDLLFSAGVSPILGTGLDPVGDRGSEIDTLSGGAGDDFLFAGYGDNVSGGDGTDNLYLSFLGASTGVTFDANTATSVPGGGSLNGIEGIPWVEGSNFDDVLTLVSSDPANLTLLGRIFGWAGNDLLTSGELTALLDGGAGNDVVDGRLGAELTEIDGGDGNDRLYGSEAAGRNWSIAINGGAGDDVLSSGSNDDVMTGGAGIDTFRFAPGDGYDTVTDLAPGETVQITGKASVFSITQDGSDVVVVYLGGQITFQGTSVSTVQAALHLLSGYGFDGTAAGEILTGTAGDDIISGFAGNDDLRGSDGADILYGDVGSDTLNGGAGADQMDGGAGADVMRGGLGNDTYYVDNAHDNAIENAGEGTDSVVSSVSFALASNIENLTITGTAVRGNGNSLANSIGGNSANNILNGGAGADVMRGGLGNDSYYVDNASDSIVENSGEGRDRVYSTITYTLGANADDLFLRGSAAINATGNSLDNTLRGNSAANVLTGGAGADDLRGGTGADTFVFRDGDFAGLTPSTSDRIIDFSHSEGDRIKLASVDANTSSDGDQAFSFIGTSAFHHVAGELRYEITNGNTYLTGDTNGDGLADFMVRLDGTHALVGGDFVL